MTKRLPGTREPDAATPATSGPRPPLTSSILDAAELEVLNAGMEARRLQAEYQRQRAADVAAHRAKQAERARQREQELRDAEDLELNAHRPPGPNLRPHVRRNPRRYVQEEDLNDVIPDGWGLQWRDDAERLGERMGMPAVGVQLLTLLEWFHGLRSSLGRSVRGTGGGLQASPEWLARKLGCSERWVQALINRLDPWAAWRRECKLRELRNWKRKREGLAPLPMPPRPGGGGVYLQRFPQLKRYSQLAPDAPSRRWVCRDGNLHEHVDLTGVLYATFLGCRSLRRRATKARAPRGKTPKLRRSPMQVDLYRRLAPLYRRLRARLAPAVPSEFTPNNVTPSLSTYVAAPEDGPEPVDTGPPARAGPCRGRWGCLPLSGAPVGEAQDSSTAPLPENPAAVPVSCSASGRRVSLAEEMAARRAELEAMGYRRV